MQIRADRDDLAEAFGRANRAVGAKAALPILQGALCQAADGRLRVTGSDTEVTVRTSVEVDMSEEGDFVVPSSFGSPAASVSTPAYGSSPMRASPLQNGGHRHGAPASARPGGCAVHRTGARQASAAPITPLPPLTRNRGEPLRRTRTEQTARRRARAPNRRTRKSRGVPSPDGTLPRLLHQHRNPRWAASGPLPVLRCPARAKNPMMTSARSGTPAEVFVIGHSMYTPFSSVRLEGRSRIFRGPAGGGSYSQPLRESTDGLEPRR